jgi:hypothetical protein
VISRSKTSKTAGERQPFTFLSNPPEMPADTSYHKTGFDKIKLSAAVLRSRRRDSEKIGNRPARWTALRLLGSLQDGFAGRGTVPARCRRNVPFVFGQGQSGVMDWLYAIRSGDLRTNQIVSIGSSSPRLPAAIDAFEWEIDEP